MAHEAHDYYGADNNPAGDNNAAGDGEDEEEIFDPEGPMDEEDHGDFDEGGNEGDEDGEAGGMRALVRTLRDIARQAGFDPDHAVQLNKLRIVLEAVGGDLDLAATLYWDDFLATAGQQQFLQAPPPPPPPPPPAQQPQPPPMMMMPFHPNPGPHAFQQPLPLPPHEELPPMDGQLRVAQHPNVGGFQNHEAAFGNDPADVNPELPVAAGLPAVHAQPPPQHPPPPAHQFMGGLVIDDSSPLVRRLDDAFRRLEGSAGRHPNPAIDPARLRRFQQLARSEAMDVFNRLAAQANVRRPPRPPHPPPPLNDAAGVEGPEADAEAIMMDGGRDPARRRRSARVAAAAAASAPPAKGGGEGGPIQRRRPSGHVRRARQDQGGEAQGAVDNGIPQGDDVALADFPARARELLQLMGGRGIDENANPEINKDGDADRDAKEKNATLRSLVGAAMRRRKKRQHEEVGDGEDGGGRSSPPAVRRRTGTSAGNRGVDSGRAEAKEKRPHQGVPGDEYLSDNDWIWEGTSYTPLSSRLSRGNVDSRPELGPPTDLLWGLSYGPSASDDFGDSHRFSSKETSNVIKDDQEEPYVDVDEDEATSGIPRTWLAAGFSLSECANALCVKPPSEDDLSFFTWKQQIQRNVPPPPYHCRSLTAVLSIVTATLLTGASVQAGRVTTASCRPPFFELSEEQRKREFESRLADALSAILFIAVQASVARKKHALKAACSEFRGHVPTDEVEKVTWNKLQHRLGLVPTCSWDTDPNTGDIRFEDDAPVQVVTTLTHVDDIRCYVRSNIKSFMSSGGVALFLETLLRVHGTGAITHMLQQNGKSDFLIRCNCEERHARKLEEIQQRSLGLGVAGASMSVPSSSQKSDSTPAGTECISVEMVSLILTGKVYSNWQGWDTGPLKFGVLTNPVDSSTFVDKRLSRPKKPVWILLGPTCYSVTYMVGCPDHADTFSRRDFPGTVAHMRHWNAWYGQRRLTTFRLTVGRHDEKLVSSSTGPEYSLTPAEPFVFDKHEPPAVRMLKERRRELGREEKDRLGLEVVDPEIMFTQVELDRVLVHPEDPKFYPNQFRLWRYDIEQPGTEVTGEEEDKILDQKQRARSWTPFCRLEAREKLLVETKLGPAIHRIFRTRWPRSTVLDRFEPDDPAPVV